MYCRIVWSNWNCSIFNTYNEYMNMSVKFFLCCYVCALCLCTFSVICAALSLHCACVYLPLSVQIQIQIGQ